MAGLLFSLFPSLFAFKSKTKAVWARTANARVSACLRAPGDLAVVRTRCGCLWECLQGRFHSSNSIYLLSNWPPEAHWAGRESADQLITSLTPHSPSLNQTQPPGHWSPLCKLSVKSWGRSRRRLSNTTVFRACAERTLLVDGDRLESTEEEGEWRGGAAGLCRRRDSERDVWWQGPGIWWLSVCTPPWWWTQTGSRGDAPSKSGQILWSCLSFPGIEPAVSLSLLPSSLSVTVFLPFTPLSYKVSRRLRLSLFILFLKNKQQMTSSPWGGRFSLENNRQERSLRTVASIVLSAHLWICLVFRLLSFTQQTRTLEHTDPNRSET